MNIPTPNQIRAESGEREMESSKINSMKKVFSEIGTGRFFKHRTDWGFLVGHYPEIGAGRFFKSRRFLICKNKT